MSPIQRTAHIDQLLSSLSVKYRNEEYIADQVFPTVMVKKQSDLYRVHSRNFRLPETLAHSSGLAREHQFEVSSSSYVLQNHKLKDYISDDEQDNFDLSDLRAETTEELMDVILRRKEKAVADLFTTTSWSQNVSLAAAWSSNTVTTNPIPTMDTAATTIIHNSGKKPNYMILPRAGFVSAKNHVSLLDRTKYTSKEMTAGIMAGLFDVEQVLVPVSSIDSSAEGAADSVGSLWGSDIAFLGFKPARPAMRTPSAGYVFQKATPTVRRWREEEREADAIEVRLKFVPKVVASLAGYLVKGV